MVELWLICGRETGKLDQNEKDLQHGKHVQMTQRVTQVRIGKDRWKEDGVYAGQDIRMCGAAIHT